MALPRWQETGGRDFVFYHSHSGYEWDDVDTTNKYQEMLCHDFQVHTRPAISKCSVAAHLAYSPFEESLELVSTAAGLEAEQEWVWEGGMEVMWNEYIINRSPRREGPRRNTRGGFRSS